MIYLLDTHTFLWVLDKPGMLPERVQRIMKDRPAQLALSLVTPWEMSIKSALGKLDAAYILDNFETLATQGGYTLLETTVRQVIRCGRLPSHHRDPFDRLLAAQALELGATLLSRDRAFDLYGVKRIWE